MLSKPKMHAPTHGRPAYDSNGWHTWLYRREVMTYRRTVWCEPRDYEKYNYDLYGTSPVVYYPVYKHEPKAGTKKDVRGAGPAKRVKTSVTGVSRIGRRAGGKFEKGGREESTTSRQSSSSCGQQVGGSNNLHVKQDDRVRDRVDRCEDLTKATLLEETYSPSTQAYKLIRDLEQDEDEWVDTEGGDEFDFVEIEEKRQGAEMEDEWEII